jgi:hypothetical protein
LEDQFNKTGIGFVVEASADDQIRKDGEIAFPAEKAGGANKVRSIRTLDQDVSRFEPEIFDPVRVRGSDFGVTLRKITKRNGCESESADAMRIRTGRSRVSVAKRLTQK